jgi:hypothetical protein
LPVSSSSTPRHDLCYTQRIYPNPSAQRGSDGQPGRAVWAQSAGLYSAGALLTAGIAYPWGFNVLAIVGVLGAAAAWIVPRQTPQQHRATDDLPVAIDLTHKGGGGVSAGRVPRSLVPALWRSLAGRRPCTASMPWAASTQIFEPALYLVSSAHGAGTAIWSIYLSPGPSALTLRELFRHHHVHGPAR